MPEKLELIHRSSEPEALEFPFHELSEYVTPNDLFFIRSHYPTPKVDIESFELSVEGKVGNPAGLTMGDLLAMPQVSVHSMLECAGNGRSCLNPPVAGLQWELGAIGSAVWTGVSVRTVLEHAGIDSTAVDIVFQGMDSGKVKTEPRPIGDVPYARSLPKDIAMADGPILAYEMNGEILSPAHGYPLRLIVPGWYAAASVKWLNRIIVMDSKFMGYYQTTDYAFWDTQDGHPVQVPLGPMPVKSAIARPVEGTKLTGGDTAIIYGAAWGDVEVVRVEVSVNGGESWNDANLIHDAVHGNWRHWDYTWKVDGQLGSRKLLSRATDAKGNSQPLERDWNYGTYVINHCHPTEVFVE